MSAGLLMLALLQGTNIVPSPPNPALEARLLRLEHERKHLLQRMETSIVTDKELYAFLMAGPDGLEPITDEPGQITIRGFSDPAWAARQREVLNRDFLRILQTQAILRSMHCVCGDK